MRSRMTNIIHRFVHDENGATAIEYALLAGIIALSIIASVGGISEEVGESFENVSDGFIANRTP